MSEKGIEKAARVADLIQAIARLLVLVIIIPTAIWLAVFTLFAGIIPDSFVRGMFSMTFGLGLAGVLVARMKYLVRGSFLTVTAAGAGAISLAMFWNTPFATIVIVHVFLVCLLGVFRYLRVRLAISHFKWLKVRNVLSATIIASAPLPAVLYLQGIGVEIAGIVVVASLLLWLYTQGTQYLLRDARLGSFNALLLAVGLGFFITNSHLSILPSSVLSVTLSAFLLGFGISFLMTTQVYRFIQRSITQKPFKKHEAILKQEEMLRSVGLTPEYEAEKQILQQISIEDTIWLIESRKALLLSGISLLFIASGVPTYFLWLISSTPWALEVAFPILFIPLAILLSLLIVVPAPVAFRLSGVIERSRESKVVKSLGFIIVVLAAFNLFAWLQFYLIPASLPLSVIVFVSGITGIFKEIRKLWRAAWTRIAGAARRIWVWIKAHAVMFGIATDTVITSVVVAFVIYPFASSLHQPFLIMGSSAALVFTLLGMIGVTALKAYPRKRDIHAAGVSVLFLSIAALSYWFFSPLYDWYTALSLASIWFLGFALLQGLGIRKRFLSLPFTIGVIGLGRTLYLFEIQFSVNQLPLLTIAALLFVSGGLLHQEYIRAFSALSRGIALVARRIASVLTRIGGTIKAALVRVGNVIKRGLIRIGGVIYRGAVWLAVQLVRFVVVLYAVVLIYFLGQYGLSLFTMSTDIDPLYLISGLTLLYLVLFTPSLIAKGMYKGRLRSACMTVLALAAGVFAFSFFPYAHISLRYSFSAVVTFLLLNALRSQASERSRSMLSYLSWFTFLVWVSNLTYLTTLEMGQLMALLLSSFIFGLGGLPLRLNPRLVRVSSLIFLLLCVPTGTLIIYLVSFDYILTIATLVALPCIVLYRQYLIVVKRLGAVMLFIGSRITTGIRMVASAVGMAVRFVLLLIAAHIVLLMGIFSFSIALLVVQLLLPALLVHEYWQFHFVFIVTLLTALVWAPTAITRRSDYPRVLSLIVIMSALSSGGLAFLTSLSWGLMNAILIALAVSSFLVRLGLGGYERRNMVIAVSSCAFAFLLLNLFAVEPVVYAGLSILTVSFLTIPFASSVTRWRILYPITTAAAIGTFMYAVVLPVAGLWLTLTSFVVTETLFLTLAQETRSWQVWWLFSIASGYMTFLLFWFLPLVQYTVPILVAVELVRLTPDSEYRFSEHSDKLGILRAILLTVILYGSLPPGSILSVEVSILAFLTITVISNWGEVQRETRFILVNILSFTLSVTIFSYLSLLLSVDLLQSAVISSMTALGILFVTSFESERRIYWQILRVLSSAIFSSLWYIGYRTVESFFLVIPTALFVWYLSSIWTPWSGIVQQGISRSFCTTAIVLVEVVWVWHAVLVFALPLSVLLLGASFLLTTTVVFPVTKNLTWLDFEMVWDFVSILLSITLGAFISGWEIALLLPPPNILLSVGWSLSIFSVLSGSMGRYNEAKQGELSSEQVSHMTWSLSIPGWTLIGYSYSVLFNPTFVVQATSLCFSFASLIFVLVHPEPRRSLLLFVNAMVSSSVALLIWSVFAFVPSIPSYILIIAIWGMLEIPTLGGYMYSGLVRFYTFIKLNSVNIALVLPVIVGVWFGSFFLFQTARPLLGLDVRHYLQAMSVATVSMGVMYLLEGAFANGTINKRVRAPSVALLGRGTAILLLSIYLPESPPDVLVISYHILGSIAVSLMLMAGLNYLFGFMNPARRSWMLSGIVILPATFLGLTIHNGLYPSTALGVALFLAFVMETPFLKSAITSALAVFARVIRVIGRALMDIGTLIGRAFRRFAHAVRIFFERFGYINWVMFSSIFALGLSYFSQSFFSDLIGMNPGSVLYWVPRYSMSVMILGLLLLTIAIIRRRVKSLFGVSCILIALGGTAVTTSTWLLDHGFVLLSIGLGVVFTSLGGLSVLLEKRIEGARISVFWVPIPVAVSLIISEFLGFTPMSLSLAIMIGTLFLLLSTFTRLLNESLRTALWIATSLTSAMTTYLISLSWFPALLSFYLAMFVAAWVIFPVALRVSKHLFAAPLFFAITGFAFTSLTSAIGEFVQGLLLALAPFLLFTALFIKEREAEQPRLAYVRLVILFALIGSLVLFGVYMMPILAP